MARRVRTAKTLAQRIDLNYFRRPHPLRRTRTLLTVAAVALAAAWVGWKTVAGDESLYTAGPVSNAHAVFGQACSTCHVGESGGYWKRVSDQACLDCHDGPQHNPRQTFTPSCASCHLEHTGAARMAAVSDFACTQCHAALRVTQGSLQVAAGVSAFVGRHPEFAALRSGRPDPGGIKLNHEVHLKPGLRGPGGNVQLECDDCHRPAAVFEPWPYGTPQLQAAASPPPGPLAARPPAARMMPVTFARSCAACHRLEFDRRFTTSVPHDTPAAVRAFVERSFRDYLARNPAAWRQVEQPERRLPGRPPAVEPPASSPEEWIRLRIAEAERVLWGKTCAECHTLSFPAGAPGRGLPEVAPASQTEHWMPRARFDHYPHRMMDCTACHAAAATSRETADVLLPGIATCQQCHRPGPASAESRCFECHTYHDWTQKSRTRGKYQIEELLRRRALRPGSRGEAGPAR